MQDCTVLSCAQPAAHKSAGHLRRCGGVPVPYTGRTCDTLVARKIYPVLEGEYNRMALTTQTFTEEEIVSRGSLLGSVAS